MVTANPGKRKIGGRPATTPFRDALQRALKAGDGQKLRRIADKLVELAEAGQEWAVKEIANRLDGKPHESVSVTATVHDVRPAEHYSDDELVAVVAGAITSAGRAGVAEPPTGAGESHTLQ